MIEPNPGTMKKIKAIVLLPLTLIIWAVLVYNSSGPVSYYVVPEDTWSVGSRYQTYFADDQADYNLGLALWVFQPYSDEIRMHSELGRLDEDSYTLDDTTRTVSHAEQLKADAEFLYHAWP